MRIELKGVLLTKEARLFLEDFKDRASSQNVLDVIKSLKDVRILVLGDSIIDQYVYCDFMEKSGKEPIVATKFKSSETHAGGVFAIANHLAEFADEVTLITCTGENHQDFIKENLNKKIKSLIFHRPNKKTILKKRYLDDYRRNKLFEVYNSDYLSPDNKIEKKIIKYLKKNAEKFDMILVSDFGHGFITENIKKELVASKKFLAVNAQLNSGNLGYNFVTKYPRADFILLNERELRLPLQERYENIEIAIKKLSDMADFNRITVTRGKYGNIYYSEGHYYNSPAFTSDVLDTIGAGDAVLSLTSLLTYKNIDPLVISFLGNCIGALAVRIMGNRRPVSSRELKKFIIDILEDK